MSPSKPSDAHTRFPLSALQWLLGPTPQDVLHLANAPGVVGLSAAEHHRLFAIDKDPTRAARLAHDPRVVAAAAEPESLPFVSCQFDRVLAHQNFHTMAPGLVLSEVARVLRPGGLFALSYLVRDDTVPWVRRLTSVVQQVDPQAMRGNFGHQSVEALLESKYFPSHDHKSFRVWISISRSAMLDMASAGRAVQELDEQRQAEFRADVARLYDETAPGSDSLRLPYQMMCWRAEVDHEELTAPISVDDTGLIIPL